MRNARKAKPGEGLHDGQRSGYNDQESSCGSVLILERAYGCGAESRTVTAPPGQSTLGSISTPAEVLTILVTLYFFVTYVLGVSNVV